MKKRNKGRKALTAMSAVVAAGLTPGFIAASAVGSSIQSPNSGTTAADVVAIDGNTYSFEELYALQNPDSVKMDTIELNIVLEPTNTTLYGSPSVVAYGTTKYGAPRRNITSISAISANYEVLEGDTIYRSVDRAPSFPGGDAALKNYLNDHIRYPANAIKNKIQGEVIIELVVKKTGEIGSVKVVRSIGKDLDDEAVRVCKSLPDFIPARLHGQDVSSRHLLPVTFTLPKANND